MVNMAATSAIPLEMEPDSLSAEALLRQRILRLGKIKKTLMNRVLATRTLPAHLADAKTTRKLQDAKSESIKNAYRLGTACTTFSAQDPDPNAVDGGRLLGVRIEAFNKVTRTLKTPTYVFLKRPFPGKKALAVHRHTVPASIDIEGLQRTHLPLPDVEDIDGTEVEVEEQDFKGFVDRLTTLLHELQAREDSINLVRTSEAVDTKEVKVLDAGYWSAQTTYVDGRIFSQTLDESGRFVGAVILSAEGERDYKLEREMRRDRDRPDVMNP
jgi:central kinetochore subunit Mal2/MCM21